MQGVRTRRSQARSWARRCPGKRAPWVQVSWNTHTFLCPTLAGAQAGTERGNPLAGGESLVCMLAPRFLVRGTSGQPAPTPPKQGLHTPTEPMEPTEPGSDPWKPADRTPRRDGPTGLQGRSCEVKGWTDGENQPEGPRDRGQQQPRANQPRACSRSRLPGEDTHSQNKRRTPGKRRPKTGPTQTLNTKVPKST